VPSVDLVALPMRGSMRSFSCCFPDDVARLETAEGRIVRGSPAVKVVDGNQAWAKGAGA